MVRSVTLRKGLTAEPGNPLIDQSERELVTANECSRANGRNLISMTKHGHFASSTTTCIYSQLEQDDKNIVTLPEV